MPAANGDGRQPTSEEDWIKELSQIPTGCYKANYPSKPSAQDPVWQESQEIFKALQPATYSSRKCKSLSCMSPNVLQNQPQPEIAQQTLVQRLAGNVIVK